MQDFSELNKNVNNAFSRLFSHSTIVSNEIRYFVNEMEEKRKEREFHRISELSNKLGVLTQKQYPFIEQQLQDLPTLTEKADRFVRESRLLCEKPAMRDKTLEANRAARQLEWEEFAAKDEARHTHLEEETKANEEALKSYYVELEQKLDTSFE